MQVFNALAALAPESMPADVESERTPESAQPTAAPVIAETAAVEQPHIAAPDLREPEVSASAAAADAQPAGAGTEILASEAVPHASADDAVALSKADGIDEQHVADQSAAVTSVEPAPPEVPASAETQPPAAVEPVAAADADNPFVDANPEQTPSDPPRRRLAVASAAMAAILAAQGVFFYRGELAARFPPAREWLGSLCAQAGCTVTLPQRPQSILIEASDLQVTDPAKPNRIQLTATLRNHAGHDVGYPALDLVLTNVNDHTLARRIFLPEDYLGAGRDPRTGIAANAEMTVRLALETGNLGAAGFRLAVLSAPAR